jgi:hypothetical protein
MSVDKMSVDKKSVDKMSVDKTSGDKMSVVKLYRRNVCTQNVCRQDVCRQDVCSLVLCLWMRSGTYPRVDHPKGASLGWTLALPANIRLGWKVLPGINALDQYEEP